MTSILYAFIDKIEEDIATLLVIQTAENSNSLLMMVPQKQLPAEAKEGSWLTFSFQMTKPPSLYSAGKLQELRTKLLSSDDGNKIVL